MLAIFIVAVFLYISHRTVTRVKRQASDNVLSIKAINLYITNSKPLKIIFLLREGLDDYGKMSRKHNWNENSAIELKVLSLHKKNNIILMHDTLRKQPVYRFLESIFTSKGKT